MYMEQRSCAGGPKDRNVSLAPIFASEIKKKKKRDLKIYSAKKNPYYILYIMGHLRGRAWARSAGRFSVSEIPYICTVVWANVGSPQPQKQSFFRKVNPRPHMRTVFFFWTPTLETTANTTSMADMPLFTAIKKITRKRKLLKKKKKVFK